MKKFRKPIALLLCLLLTFGLAACDEEDNSYSKITDFEPHVFEFSEGITAYGYYDIGNCRKLTGDVYTLVIFLDDKESRWNDLTRAMFYDWRFFPSITYITEQAELRDVELNLQCGQYTTKQNTDYQPYYDGVVANSAANAINNIDIFKQTAETLGFPNKEVLHGYIQNYTGCEQIAYVLMLNKPGRAYAVTDTTYNDKDSIEFVVGFSSDLMGNRSIGSSVIHEILHLFGATDLYDDLGKYPAREKLCKELYPNDIMMRSATDPNDLEIGRLTEALIGWSDYFPPECDCPEWWETDYVESHRPDFKTDSE